MNHRQIRSDGFSTNNFSLLPKPEPAWIAILTLVLFTVLGILAGAGSILRLTFPLGAFAVGIFLYRKYPILYIGFTWWLWFLTPLVRRLVDYRSGWVEPSPLLIAPFLVSLVTLVSVWKYLPKTYHLGGLPFLLAFASLLYGFLIGLIQSSPITATRALLDWLAPVSFGFHLFINWRDYPSYRQNIQRTFLWGVLIMGIYGVVQYLIAPEWDCFWLIESKMYTSSGQPEPMGMRIWSTMNAPGPFAGTMLVGLLLLFSCNSSLLLPAAGFGYLSFLLTLVRSAWGPWLVGTIILASSLKSQLQIRLIITMVVMALTIVPVITIDQFSKPISQRLETLSNLDEDNSAKERQNFFNNSIGPVLSNPLGSGIGNSFYIDQSGQLKSLVIDSGIISLFFTLGWFGVIPYLGAIVLLFVSVFQYTEFRFDPFMAAARAVCITFLMTLIIANALIGIYGLLFWSFMALIIAAHRYYQYQLSLHPKGSGQSLQKNLSKS